MARFFVRDGSIIEYSTGFNVGQANQWNIQNWLENGESIDGINPSDYVSAPMDDYVQIARDTPPPAQPPPPPAPPMPPEVPPSPLVLSPVVPARRVEPVREIYAAPAPPPKQAPASIPYAEFEAAFNAPVGDPRYRADLDADNSGIVDFADFLALTASGRLLPPEGAPPAEPEPEPPAAIPGPGGSAPVEQEPEPERLPMPETEEHGAQNTEKEEKNYGTIVAPPYTPRTLAPGWTQISVQDPAGNFSLYQHTSGYVTDRFDLASDPSFVPPGGGQPPLELPPGTTDHGNQQITNQVEFPVNTGKGGSEPFPPIPPEVPPIPYSEFEAAFNAPVGDPRYRADLDADNSGVVDFADFLALSDSGRLLPPGGGQPPLELPPGTTDHGQQKISNQVEFPVNTGNGENPPEQGGSPPLAGELPPGTTDHGQQKITNQVEFPINVPSEPKAGWFLAAAIGAILVIRGGG